MIILKVNQDEYLYHLPEDRIAKYPLENRSDSKLLVVNRKSKEISHEIFNNIVKYISNCHLIFNKTKVINARIKAKKSSGGKAEIFCLNPMNPSTDPQITLMSKSPVTWQCMIGGKNIKAGSILFDQDEKLSIEVIKKEKNEVVCNFSWSTEESFIEIISKIGKIPIPPYLKRDSEESDKNNYQTVYAKKEGSVAAPTAGLHFTESILKKIDETSKISELTLHVGAGTFQPIQTADLKQHSMHQELVNIELSTIKELIVSLKNNIPIVSVGTTSMRSLESLALFGERLLAGKKTDEFYVDQWDGYYEKSQPLNSLKKVVEWLENKDLEELKGETKMMIIPGYKFRLVDHLITNFHQPGSSLIMLVGAFLGKDLWKHSYQAAIENNYRFLSYGDSSILL